MKKTVMKIKAQAGVLGYPIAHSLSPQLHGFWLKKHHIAADYKAYEVAPEKLADFLKSLAQKDFRGVNLTIPHKEAALEILDTVDDLARRIGAVNTVVVEQDGTLRGMNTDAYGFITNLKEKAPKWQAKEGPAALFGAGGAARALIVGLLDAGVEEIYLLNRTFERAQKLGQILADKRIKPLPWDQRNDILAHVNLLVNSTSQGMRGHEALDINLDLLSTQAVVSDIVYNPLETPLLKAARRRGNPVVDGLGMLLHQAVPAFEAWFGLRPQVDLALYQHMEDILRGKQHHD